MHAAHGTVDHVFCRGLERLGSGETLHRGELSDHAPLAVDLRRPDPAGEERD